MKIDLHLHTSERSSCSISTEKEQIEHAIKFGLDAIVITDHNKLVPKEHLKKLNERYSPFKIFGGIEITIADKGEDVLVIGPQDDILQEKKWTYEDLYSFVRSKKGFIALNHPYRYTHNVKIDVYRYIPDAIEIHSTNIGNCDEEIIKNLSSELGTGLIANSDGHNCEHIGIYYNDLEDSPANEMELAECLKEKKYVNKADAERIYRFNSNVKEREILIHKLISEGKTTQDYHSLTGNWTGEFDRVLLGKSYEI